MRLDLPAAFAEAIEHHKAGRFAEAAAGYRRIVDAQPDAADAWHLLGVLSYQGGRAAEAVEEISRAIALQPGEADYRSNLGNALGALGRSEEAIAAYQEAIRLAPALLDARLNLGNAFLRDGRLEAAGEQYRSVLARHPDHPQALNNLGTILRRQGDPDGALACFQRALERAPGYRDALLNFARALLACGRGDEAIAPIERHLRDHPDDEAVQALLGSALWAARRLPEAQRAFERAIELAPDADLYNGLGAILRERGENARARKVFAQALELDPSNAAAQTNLGVAHLENDPGGALPHLQRALEIDPDHVIAWYSLGAAHQELGEIDRAGECFEKALDLEPTFHPAYYSLLTLHRVRGLREEMRALTRRWLEHAPDHPSARHHAAALGLLEAPERCSDAYVQEEFDAFARTYEQRLAAIRYRGPGLLQEALGEVHPAPDGSLTVLDAGCGTGLCAPVLAPYARRLVGVDLSEGMLAKAEGQGYDELVTGELTAYLRANPGAFDLILSGDTLIYFGALEELVAVAAAALRGGGHLAFTTERLDDDAGSGFALSESGRYRHAPTYVRHTLESRGFEVPVLRQATTRLEADRPVSGLVVVARKAGGRAAPGDAPAG